MTASTAQRTPSRLSSDHFEAVTHRIESVLCEYRGDLQAGYRVAHTRYVAGEPIKPLADFAGLLLAAPYTLYCQTTLRKLQQLRQEQNGLTAAQQAGYDQLRPAVCGYNHKLTIFIDRCRSMLERPMLFDWLLAAAGHRDDWPRPVRARWVACTLSGCVGEVVGADLLRLLVQDLRHGSVQADIERGTDFQFRLTRRQIRTADIKTGASCLSEPVVRRGAHIILSIQSEHINGFYLKPEWVSHYTRALTRVL